MNHNLNLWKLAERKKDARNSILLFYIIGNYNKLFYSLFYICCFLIVSNANPQIVKSTKNIKEDLNKIVPTVNIRGNGK